MPPARSGDDPGRPDERLGQPLTATCVPTAAPAPPAAAGRRLPPADVVEPRRSGGLAPASRWGSPAGRRTVRALVGLARPRQWVKNLLVVAAPGAAGVLADRAVSLRVAGAFAAFCLLSAGTYMVNDVRDAAEDRDHPRKRLRPVAAGDIGPATALAVGAGAMGGGLALCLLVRPLLLAVGAGYLAVTLTYSLVWRSIALADVAAIAGGFVLRATAGGVAAPVGLSRSFVLVVTFTAVFVAVGKRRSELSRPRNPSVAARRVLAVYTSRRLGQILVASAGLALTAYCVWALDTHLGAGIPWRAITVLPFGACLVRWGVLLGRGQGEAPEEMLLEDRPLQLLALVWAVLFALSVHAAG